jgi:hypothetical protein
VIKISIYFLFIFSQNKDAVLDLPEVEIESIGKKNRREIFYFK